MSNLMSLVQQNEGSHLFNNKATHAVSNKRDFLLLFSKAKRNAVRFRALLRTKTSRPQVDWQNRKFQGNF